MVSGPSVVLTVTLILALCVELAAMKVVLRRSLMVRNGAFSTHALNCSIDWYLGSTPNCELLSCKIASIESLNSKSSVSVVCSSMSMASENL